MQHGASAASHINGTLYPLRFGYNVFRETAYENITLIAINQNTFRLSNPQKKLHALLISKAKQKNAIYVRRSHTPSEYVVRTKRILTTIVYSVNHTQNRRYNFFNFNVE